jgi:hypothetical protein
MGKPGEDAFCLCDALSPVTPQPMTLDRLRWLRGMILSRNCDADYSDEQLEVDMIALLGLAEKQLDTDQLERNAEVRTLCVSCGKYAEKCEGC